MNFTQLTTRQLELLKIALNNHKPVGIGEYRDRSDMLHAIGVELHKREQAKRAGLLPINLAEGGAL